MHALLKKHQKLAEGNMNVRLTICMHTYIQNQLNNCENGFRKPENVKICKHLHNESYIMIKILFLNYMCPKTETMGVLGQKYMYLVFI